MMMTTVHEQRKTNTKLTCVDDYSYCSRRLDALHSFSLLLFVNEGIAKTLEKRNEYGRRI